MAGPMYRLEAQLRELCKDIPKNGEQIYIKCKELAGRLLARNTSRMGPDVDRWTLDHEIAAEITTRLCAGTLDPITNWSGYINCILPRMIKANAAGNGTQVVDVHWSNIDIKAMIDMNHSGSLGIIKRRNEQAIEMDLKMLPDMINRWLDKNLRYISKDTKEYYNMRLSIFLSLIRGVTTLYRLPQEYSNQVIVYTNRIKLYIVTTLNENLPDNPYDEVMKIACYEEEEDHFD